MLSGVVVDILLFLVGDGVCCLLEEGGLLRGMKETDNYVENVYESSTREKDFESSKDPLEDSISFYCSLRTRKRE